MFKLSGYFRFALLLVLAITVAACAEKSRARYEKLAEIIKKVPSMTKCQPLGVMYGRANKKERALLDLRANTARSGGTHVIITETDINNKEEFSPYTVTSTFVLGNGYKCSQQ